MINVNFPNISYIPELLFLETVTENDIIIIVIIIAIVIIIITIIIIIIVIVIIIVIITILRCLLICD